MSSLRVCLISFFVLSSICLAVPHGIEKRLQWRTYVVCPGGEIALGERCNPNLEKKALPHFLGFRRYYNSVVFPPPRPE